MVVLVANSAWGIYNFRIGLLNFFKANGIDVVLIFPFDKKYTAILKESFQCVNLFMIPNQSSPVNELKTIFYLSRILLKLKPRLVLSFTIKPNIYCSLISKFFKFNIITNITGLGSNFLRSSISELFFRVIYRISFSPSNINFFQNIHDMNFFLDNKISTKNNSFLIPGSGVDLKRFSPRKIQTSKEFNFLVISRLIKDKGINELILAIKSLEKKAINKKFKFTILGSYSKDNRNSISNSNFNFILENNLISYVESTDKIEDFIAKSDCLVLPSYREGIPRSILEGFAMGKPAIVSNVPGCADLVENGINGLICKSHSSKDLEKRIIQMLNFDKVKIKHLGLNGRLKVEKFYDEKIVFRSYFKKVNKFLNV